ncbi:hypothetical protein OIU76_012867 [Salix suchowensis]|nr:hypothetical protein OIU76_012867 [Salix suchowensis]
MKSVFVSPSLILLSHEFMTCTNVNDPFLVISPISLLPQAALVLNASRRFRYTLDLKKDEEKEQRRRMIRSHAHVIRAALLFRLRGEQQIVLGPSATPSTATGDYAIGLEELASMTRDHNISSLQHCGGVKGLSKMLKTNLATGIVGDENDLIKRMNTFGANRYPQKKWTQFFEVPLGSLARFNPHHLDCSCHSFTGIRNQDRGFVTWMV